MTKTPLNTTANRQFVHRFSNGGKTLCGQTIERPAPNPKLRITKQDEKVTCRRCLKSMSEHHTEEVVIEPNLDAFTKAMKAFTDMIAPALDLQTRMMHVGKMVADANTARKPLGLTAYEVESLALLLYLLGQPKK